jgi:hypothetical protein
VQVDLAIPSIKKIGACPNGSRIDCRFSAAVLANSEVGIDANTRHEAICEIRNALLDLNLTLGRAMYQGDKIFYRLVDMTCILRHCSFDPRPDQHWKQVKRLSRAAGRQEIGDPKTIAYTLRSKADRPS